MAKSRTLTIWYVVRAAIAISVRNILSDTGCRVGRLYAFDWKDGDGRGAIPVVSEKKRGPYVQVTLLNKVKPDEFYNLAAQSHVHTSFELPVYTAHVDGIGTLNCLEAIRQAGLAGTTKFYQVRSHGQLPPGGVGVGGGAGRSADTR